MRRCWSGLRTEAENVYPNRCPGSGSPAGRVSPHGLARPPPPGSGDGGGSRLRLGRLRGHSRRVSMEETSVARRKVKRSSASRCYSSRSWARCTRPRPAGQPSGDSSTPGTSTSSPRRAGGVSADVALAVGLADSPASSSPRGANAAGVRRQTISCAPTRRHDARPGEWMSAPSVQGHDA